MTANATDAKDCKKLLWGSSSPNLAKQIDFQEVQENQRVPKKLDPIKHTLRHIIITLPKIKNE